MTDYIFRLLIALDQLANVLICNGSPVETMSSVAWRMERDGYFWGFMRPVIDFIFSPWGPNHCQKSYQAEITRAYAPQELK